MNYLTNSAKKALVVLTVAAILTPTISWMHAIHTEAKSLKNDPAFRIVAKNCDTPKNPIFKDYWIDEKTSKLIACN